MEDRFNILSLSGGGVRGIYTSQVIFELETRFSTQMHKHVDLFCGTSIGGILAIGLAAEIPANELLGKLKKHRKLIFPEQKNYCYIPFSGKIAGFIKNLFLPQFDPKALKRVLVKIFGTKKIKDLKHNILVPSIDYTTGTLRSFKTPHSSNFYQDQNHSLVDVCLATAAAPTYFPNHEIGSNRYVDAGIVINNPMLMGLIEAQSVFKIPLNKIHILSIGNMGQKKAANHSNSINKGLLGWRLGKGIIDLSMSVNETLSYNMTRLLLSDEQVKEIDSKATDDQTHLLDLSNSSDASATVLMGHAKTTAGHEVNSKFIINFINHQKED